MFWLGEIIKVLISTVEISAIFLLVLSIYRFPLRYSYIKSVTMSLILSIILTTMRDIVHIFDYAALCTMIVEFILIMILFKMPTFYSLILVASTSLIAGVTETVVSLLGAKLGLTNFETIAGSVKLLFIEDSMVTILCTILIIFLQFRKIGFTFMAKQISTSKTLKGYNFLISFILLCFLTSMQIFIATPELTIDKLLFSLLNFLIFLAYIFFAYKKNKKLLNIKYGNFETTTAMSAEQQSFGGTK